ncbi:hypothetical protein FACS1894178_2590 [Bacteroidia bacterium]|nr:hypothetical protein FACS1894178_2590 [Bacteroidia bacterium]
MYESGTSIANKEYYYGYNYSASSSTGGVNNGLPSPNPTKDSAYFVGWYATPDFLDGQISNSSTVEQNVTTLYARWAEKVWVSFIDYEQETVQRKPYYHCLSYSSSPNTSLANAIPSTRPGFYRLV